MAKYLDETGLSHFWGNIKAKSVRAFETAADMQVATDLAVGMVAHTNGFHASGDGGAAYYTIGTSGTANGMDVLALQGGLFATLVVTEPYITPEMFGAYGDGTHDDTTAIQAAVTSGKNVSFGKQKTYKITSDITFHTSIDLNYSTLNLVGASLIVDDGLSLQNHYGFGITVSNGYMVGDNTNTLFNIEHSTKTSIINVSFKNFQRGIYVGTGYEHNIEDCRFIGNSSVQCTAIEKNDGDGFIRNVTGVDCHKGVVIVRGKHYISNIHFWINTKSLISGSVMITYTGAGQSNLTVEYAYFDSYETGIYKSGLSTLFLNNSNIVMATGLLSGDYYLFEFGDTNQNFLVSVNNLALPWSNEANFKISGTQKAMFHINYGKMSYAMRNAVKDYFTSQISWLNGITAASMSFDITPNTIELKGRLTIPSDFDNTKKALSFVGAYFPVQIVPIKGSGSEYAITSGYDLFIQNCTGKTVDLNASLSYLPQYT